MTLLHRICGLRRYPMTEARARELLSGIRIFRTISHDWR